ncbi:hypothetical protein [Mesoflavibacter zeaxanthinifaciens]|uniref:hypothetical protein n=1 Tax=Mesoflavibacter zeaxanthinifaciens TaxID=393060 RepID=UPI003A956E94
MTKKTIDHKYKKVYNTFKNDKKTEGFDLKNIYEIYLPFYECKQSIVAEKTVAVDRFSNIILSTIKAGLTTHAEICAFLGVKEDDFVTMQFHYLLKNNLITEQKEGYVITRNGLNFLNKKYNITQVEVIEFKYYYNAMTQTYFDPLQLIDTKRKIKFSGYKMLQTHKLNTTIQIEHNNRPTFNNIKQTDFAAFFNKAHTNSTFYDFENQEIETHKRSIAFLCLEYESVDNQKKYEIRQYKKTVEKSNGYVLEKTLTKAVNKYLKQKPNFFIQYA